MAGRRSLFLPRFPIQHIEPDSQADGKRTTGREIPASSKGEGTLTSRHPPGRLSCRFPGEGEKEVNALMDFVEEIPV